VSVESKVELPRKSSFADVPALAEFTVTHRLALLSLYAFLLSPLAIQAWLGGRNAVGDKLFVFSVVTSLLWLALAYVATQRPARMHLLLLPLYVTTAVDLFLLANFGARLSSGYVTILITDKSDIDEFLATYGLAVALVTALLALVYVPSIVAMRGSRRRASRRWALAVGGLLLVIYGLAFGRGVYQGWGWRTAALDLAAHETGAPMGVAFQSAVALKLHADSKELREARARFSFGATKAPSSAQEIYVWVVGESSRPANWSLFGYARDTTPRLRATPGVIAMPHMLTTAPHTSVAVPSMLSLRPITDWNAIQSEKSIVGAFNETGFVTHWLSTQDVDSWAGIVPQLASESKHRRYFDRGFDGALLAPLREIVDNASASSKLFIVLQTKGSHFDFSRRYPAEFARYSTPGGSRRDSLVDAYDNSIVYTDWFLAELINILDRKDLHATLVYTSDHGENLLDDDKQLLGHAVANQHDLQTAAFMWFSQATRNAHADKISNAERHANARLSLSDLPHSLLDLAGIRTRQLDLRKSVFQPTFEPQRRSYFVRGELRQEPLASSPDDLTPDRRSP
jgi:glucan phosphoethanolaminetransferase (alkaline phosphatase superfamily)